MKVKKLFESFFPVARMTMKLIAKQIDGKKVYVEKRIKPVGEMGRRKSNVEERFGKYVRQ